MTQNSWTVLPKTALERGLQIGEDGVEGGKRDGWMAFGGMKGLCDE